MPSPPTLLMRLRLAADAGLLPGGVAVASLQLPAPEACSAWRWLGGVTGDGDAFWLVALPPGSGNGTPGPGGGQASWWRVGPQGATRGIRHGYGWPPEAMAQIAAQLPGDSGGWLLAEEVVEHVWQDESGAIVRVTARLPAVDGRAALALLEPVWRAAGLEPPGELVQGAIAAARTEGPGVVLELHDGRLVGVGMRLRQPDPRTAHIVAGAMSPRREHLTTLLAFAPPERVEVVATGDRTVSRLWATLA